MALAPPASQGVKFRIPDKQGGTKLVDWAPPTTKLQLQKYCELFFGIKIAAKAVCPNHQAPLDALWAAYKGDEGVVVWKASRGLGGKSTMMGTLGMIDLRDGADVVVLGGSARQSKRVHEVEIAAWNHQVRQGEGDAQVVLDGPFKSVLAQEPTSFLTRTTMGNSLVAIAASSKSARGPHPQKLLVDEVDELDQGVFDSAMGQPMEGRGHTASVVIGSTHQYPDGTMTYVLDQAKEKGWPVFEWCYKENRVANGGWLSDKQIELSKNIVSKEMWLVEYELQEPSIEGRLLSADTIKHTFIGELFHDVVGRYYEFESFNPRGSYATGCDWGKNKDFTVIETYRYDCVPWRLVAYERTQGETWPGIVEKFERRRRRYPGIAVHDAWGIGNVVKDYFTIPDAIHYVAMGHERTEMYGNYIFALQQEKMHVSPVIESMFNEHKYVIYKDLYEGGHPPDTVSAGALVTMGILGAKSTKEKRRPGHFSRVRRF